MDEADKADERIEAERSAQIEEIRAREFDPGIPGDCDICGDWSGRLVGGACAPCRDRYGLE